MDKIIYFTNAVSPDMFEDYLKEWKVSPNLSNQNFHSKLIKAISHYLKVEVISVRPINNNFSKKVLNPLESYDKNIIWKYPKVSTNKIAKYLFLNSRINKVLSNDKDQCVIIVDALNLSLLRAAKKLGKKKKCKVYGVCTDNPYNISFVDKKYTDKLMKLARTLDGYLVLTKAINDLFNVNHKRYFIIDGINEEIGYLPEPPVKGKYIYFGGSLMKEYGLYDLIDAYNSLNLKNIKLVICGHHLVNDLFEKIDNNPNIVYLGPVSYTKNLSLERGSIVTVNPRPINPKIDEYSIPSKTLECLSAGAINITVENKLLKENYDDCIIWAKSSSKEDLADAIKRALALSKEEREALIELATERVLYHTNPNVIGRLVIDLIT